MTNSADNILTGDDLAAEPVRPAAVIPARWGKVGLLALGHVFVDGYCTLTAPLLAYLGLRLGISPAWAGGFFAAAAVGASFSQPLWGYLCDRYGGRWALVVSPMVAACVVMIGWTNHYWLIVALIVLGGMGTAAFHPVSGTLAGRLAEPRRPMGVAVFIAAGMAGVGLFPVAITQIVARTDLSNVWPLVIPAPFLSWMLWMAFRHEPCGGHPADGSASFSLRGAFAGQKRPIVLLFIMTVLRCFPICAFQVAIPFMVAERFGNVRVSGYLMGLFSTGLGLGGILGSLIAHPRNERALLIGSLTAAVPVLLFFSFAPGWWVLVAALAAGGVVGSTVPLAIAMGQRLAPRGSQIFNAMMMGFAWGTSGVLAPILIPLLMGKIGYGGATALAGLAMIPAIGAAVCLPRPRDAGRIADDHGRD